MDTVPRFLSGRTTIFLTKYLARFAMGLSLMLLASYQAAAQYGGGGGTMGGGGTPGYTPPTGGYSSAKGAGIGAGAAAGAGILFLTLHYHGRVTGCVQPADDGLRLVDEKNNKSYTLVPGDVYLRAGQHVQLKGQKSKNDKGSEMFRAHKLVKDLGSCNPSSAAKSNAEASR